MRSPSTLGYRVEYRLDVAAFLRVHLGAGSGTV
jgi:hypothetical protein